MCNLLDFLINRHIIDLNTLKYAESPNYNFQNNAVILDSNMVRCTVVEKSSLWDFRIIDMRIGKYFTMAYNGLTPAQVTHICEKIKSVMEEPGTFKILEGDDLKSAYYVRNYVPSHGTLNNSCMRYKRCQDRDFFKVYGDNAKMIIMTPKKGKRLLGRAILWESNGKFYMDRVYSIDNYIQFQFYEYAKSQGWNILNRNSYTESYSGRVQAWLTPEDSYSHSKALKVSIRLKESCNTFPFMDSFCYLSANKQWVSTHPYNNGYRLQDTNGCILPYHEY